MSHPRRRTAAVALFSAVFLAAPLIGCSDCHGDFDPLATAAVVVGVVSLGLLAHDCGSIDGMQYRDFDAHHPGVYSDHDNCRHDSYRYGAR